MREGLAKAVALSSVLLVSSLTQPAYARPPASPSSVTGEICTADGREAASDGTTANGNRVLQFVDGLIRPGPNRIPASEAERLRPCMASDYAAAERALSAQPHDDETEWIEEFLHDAPSASQPVVFRQSA